MIFCYTSTLYNIRHMHNLSRKNIYNRYIIYPSYIKLLLYNINLHYLRLGESASQYYSPYFLVKIYFFLSRSNKVSFNIIYISSFYQSNRFNQLLTICTAHTIYNLRRIEIIYIIVFFLLVGGIFTTKHSVNHSHFIVYAMSQNGHSPIVQFVVKRYYNIVLIAGHRI